MLSGPDSFFLQSHLKGLVVILFLRGEDGLGEGEGLAQDSKAPTLAGDSRFQAAGLRSLSSCDPSPVDCTSHVPRGGSNCDSGRSKGEKILVQSLSFDLSLAAASSPSHQAPGFPEVS